MTTPKVTRAQKLFELIQAKTGLTDAGKDWLIAALDPMHDEKLLCQGYPDRETAPSVVQVIKQSIAIAKPSGYGSTDKWGFHVRVDDSLYNGYCQRTSGGAVIVSQGNSITEDLTAGNPSSRVKHGGLTIVVFDQTVNGTSEVTVSTTTETGTNNSTQQLQINPANFGIGKCRVISQGFECVNTTPELYRGGALAVYEQPSMRDDPYTVYLAQAFLNPGLAPDDVYIRVEDKASLDVIDIEECCKSDSSGDCFIKLKTMSLLQLKKLVGAFKFYVLTKLGFQEIPADKARAMLPNLLRYGAASVVRDVLPPRSLAELLILPGSQQWDAKKGCYCVQTMNDMENPPTYGTPRGTLYLVNELAYPIPGYNSGSAGPVASNSEFISFMTNGSNFSDLGYGLVCFQENQIIPFNTKGAVISGQDPNATWTINYNTVIERVISSQDQTLATLAKPSPCQDEVATSLYSEISQRIPIGVIFSDNSMGDWILGMADQIANVVSTVGKPVLQAVDAYQQSRSGATPVGASFRTPSQKPVAGKTKNKKMANGQKGKVVVQGPRLPSGNFNSPQAKQMKMNKPGRKRSAKK